MSRFIASKTLEVDISYFRESTEIRIQIRKTGNTEKLRFVSIQAEIRKFHVLFKTFFTSTTK